MNSDNILIITFEYGKNISGGIGSCLNGLVHCIQDHANITVVVLYWNFKYSYFSCVEYQGSSIVKKHSEPIEKTILQLLADKKFTVAHIHHAAREMLALITLIKRNAAPIRLIYSCHSIFKHERNVRAVLDESIHCEQSIFDLVDAIHVLTAISKTRLLANYPYLHEKPIYIIPNGIANADFLLSGLVQFTRNCWRFFLGSLRGTKGKTIICASRWAPAKGIEFFLDAIPEVLAKNPDTRFLLIGQRNNTWDDQSTIDYKNFLQQKIDAIKSNVITYGWISRWKLALLIKESDIYAMPSECESFPYSFLEPAFIGTAIVASKIDTVEEMAVNGKHFLGFTPASHIDLAQKLTLLINDDSLRENLSANAKRLCKEKYSWSVLSNSYLTMYATTRKMNS